MATELTPQLVLREWLLTMLGELGGSVPTARALKVMEQRYGALLSEEDWALTQRGDESKWWNRTRFERKNMERAKLLVPASVSRGIWTLTEAGWEEYRKIQKAGPAAEALEEPKDSSPTQRSSEPAGQESPSRAEVTTQRIIRSTAVADYVKAIHDHTCQICGTRLITSKGAYSEGAHIRPLGHPHSGPDIAANVLCLCPNHHVLFDFGMLSVSDDLIVTDHSSESSLGHLRQASGHFIGGDYLAYHRKQHGR
ncbi:HNH endonuclease [Streptomyces sp. NPDC001220]